MSTSSYRVAAITGAASGIGLALARLYASRGVKVIAGYYPMDPHDPRKAAAEVEAAGGDALWLPLDVGSTESVNSFIEQGIAKFGRLDYVVASAGILRRAPIGEMSDERWNEMLNVDLTGVMRSFRSAVAHLSEGASLVAVSSIAGGVYGWEDHAHYAAAKAGIPGICRSMAVELAHCGVRCNAVIPGVIETPQSLDKQNSLGPDGLAETAKSIPLQRVGTADEVASVIAFLTSDESSYVTGQSLIIDGGLTVAWPA